MAAMRAPAIAAELGAGTEAGSHPPPPMSPPGLVGVVGPLSGGFTSPFVGLLGGLLGGLFGGPGFPGLLPPGGVLLPFGGGAGTKTMVGYVGLLPIAQL